MKDLVLLNGWGFDAGVWDEVVTKLKPAFRVHRLNDDEYDKTPAHAIVCGWSLGAQVAMRWALQFPAQIEKLILIATTPCFMQRQDWPYGMTSATFANFAQGLDKDAAGTLQRFAGLVAHGDVNAKEITRTLRDTLLKTPAHENAGLSVSSPLTLGAGLAQLAQTDLRKDVSNIKTPALVIHGANDAITPAAAGAWLAENLPNAKLELWENTAHAPFLSNPEKFVRQLVDFSHE